MEFDDLIDACWSLFGLREPTRDEQGLVGLDMTDLTGEVQVKLLGDLQSTLYVYSAVLLFVKLDCLNT